MNDLARIAQENLKALLNSPYPGRVLGIGQTPDGTNAIIPYDITVRSRPNQNRAAVRDPDGTIRTVFADPEEAKDQDPTNIIYPLMLSDGRVFVVSNGKQTTDAFTGVKKGGLLDDSLASWQYEDDSLGTTRLTGSLVLTGVGSPIIQLSMLRKKDPNQVREDEDGCDRWLFTGDLPPAGYARFIRTYEGDDQKPTTYLGDSFLLPVASNDAREFMYEFWDWFDERYQVAAVVRTINLRTGEIVDVIKNKKDPVPATT